MLSILSEVGVRKARTKRTVVRIFCQQNKITDRSDTSAHQYNFVSLARHGGLVLALMLKQKTARSFELACETH